MVGHLLMNDDLCDEIDGESGCCNVTVFCPRCAKSFKTGGKQGDPLNLDDCPECGADLWGYDDSDSWD